MKSNNWLKPIHTEIPYLAWNSTSPSARAQWFSVRHNNTAYELHIILDGSCLLELDEHDYTLQAGQAIIIFPGTYHACKSHSSPFLRFTVSFFPQETSPFYELAANGSHYSLFDASPNAQRICHDIFREVDKQPCYLGQETLSALHSLLMTDLLRMFHTDPEQEPHLSSSDAFNIIDQFFASFNLQEGHTRKALSERLFCSERQVGRIIQDLYHMTFKEKRLQARMDYAKMLLRSTELSIPEISSLVGYSNDTTFYRVFKSYFGTTPKKFRLKHQRSGDTISSAPDC